MELRVLLLTTSAPGKQKQPTSEDPYFRLDSEMFTKARAAMETLRVFISPVMLHIGHNTV